MRSLRAAAEAQSVLRHSHLVPIRLSVLLLIGALGCAEGPDDASGDLASSELAAQECEPTAGQLPPPPPDHVAGLYDVIADVRAGRVAERSPAWAERVLTEAESFVGPIGPQNWRSLHADAFRVLLGLPSDSAAAAFRRVYERAHAPGQIYALAGLRETAPGEYEPLAGRFAERRDWVLVWDQDEATCIQAGDLVRSDSARQPTIGSGGFRSWVLGAASQVP